MEGLETNNQFHKIRGVIFDFDGTLAVLNIDFHEMKEKVFELIKHYGVGEELIHEKYLLEIIEEVYQFLLEKNLPDAGEFYQEAHQVLYEIEIRAAEQGKLLPGIKRLLKGLREKRLKVGIITRNCEEAVRKVFPDIDEFCDVFISRDSIKKVKPHPDHLSSAMRALNIAGEEGLMIGDHPIDIQTGKKMGMKTIGVLTGRTKKEEFEEAEADHILYDATEVYRLLTNPQIR